MKSIAEQQSETINESTAEQSNHSNDAKGSKAKKGKKSSEDNIVLKPLKNDVRTRQNEKYPTYECKEHKVVLDAKDTEDLLLKKSISFFKQLSSTDFDKLYGSQLKENLKQIKARKGKQQTELEKLEEKLLAATKKWVKQKNEANKAKLLECSEEVKSMKEEMTNLEMLKNELEDIPKRIKDIEKNVLSERTFNQLSFIEKQDLMKDIISKVMVDDISIQIVFKHPFLERAEVLV
jgi:site-specific DNA recombinase